MIAQKYQFLNISIVLKCTSVSMCARERGTDRETGRESAGRRGGRGRGEGEGEGRGRGRERGSVTYVVQVIGSGSNLHKQKSPFTRNYANMYNYVPVCIRVFMCASVLPGVHKTYRVEGLRPFHWFVG